MAVSYTHLDVYKRQALYLVNIFLPKVEPLNSILMVAALVFCVILLISHLCYTPVSYTHLNGCTGSSGRWGTTREMVSRIRLKYGDTFW